MIVPGLSLDFTLDGELAEPKAGTAQNGLGQKIQAL